MAGSSHRSSCPQLKCNGGSKGVAAGYQSSMFPRAGSLEGYLNGALITAIASTKYQNKYTTIAIKTVNYS